MYFIILKTVSFDYKFAIEKYCDLIVDDEVAQSLVILESAAAWCFSFLAVPTRSSHLRLLIMFTTCLIFLWPPGINWQAGHTLKKSSKPCRICLFEVSLFFSPSCHFVATIHSNLGSGQWMSASQGGSLMSVCLVSVQGEMPSLPSCLSNKLAITATAEAWNSVHNTLPSPNR